MQALNSLVHLHGNHIIRMQVTSALQNKSVVSTTDWLQTSFRDSSYESFIFRTIEANRMKPKRASTCRTQSANKQTTTTTTNNNNKTTVLKLKNCKIYVQSAKKASNRHRWVRFTISSSNLKYKKNTCNCIQPYHHDMSEYQ